MVRRPISTAILGLAMLPVMAQAQSTPAKPTRAQVQNAATDLKVIASALGSDKVPQGVKEALFQCLYENTLARMSGKVTEVLTANKLNRTDPGKVLGVMAGICGYRPAKAPATGK